MAGGGVEGWAPADFEGCTDRGSTATGEGGCGVAGTGGSAEGADGDVNTWASTIFGGCDGPGGWAPAWAAGAE